MPFMFFFLLCAMLFKTAVFFLLFRYASEAGRGGIPPLPSDAVSLLWLVGAAALLASALITVCLYREHEYLQ